MYFVLPMVLVIQLAALPVVFLFWLGWLYAANRRTGIWLGLACFGLPYVIGVWRLLSTDPASATVRLVLLPYEAVLAGLLGLAYGYGRVSPKLSWKIGGRLCLTAAALLIAAVTIG